MALTKIPAHLSSTPSISDSGSSTAITIDSSGNVAIAGNLSVTGSTTTADNLTSADKNITLNYHASNDTSGSAGGAGITIQDAVNSSTDATILWDASNDEFDFSHQATLPGLKLGVNTSLYNQDATISYYAANNGVYVNGAGTNGWLRLNASGAENARNAIDLYGQAGGDYIKIKAANTDTMYIGAGAAGRVGIGTSTPDSNLHIKTSVDNSVAQGLVIERSANTDKGYINYNGGAFQIRSTVGDPIAFGETDAEHMRIAPDGNVGISTSSPEGLLHVHGGDSGSSYTADGADRLIIEHSDSVAIDLRTPASNQALILFSDGTRGQGLIGYNHSDDSLRFSNSGNLERMRITGAGDVLVGTNNTDIGGSVTGVNLKSTGAAMFSMDETGTYNQPLYADRRGTNNTGTVLAMGMGGYFKAAIDIHGTNASTDDAAISFNTWSGNTTKTERMRITSAGNVGIGVTPSYRLHVKTASGGGTWPIRVEASPDNDLLFGVYESSNGDGNHGMIYLNDGGGTTDVKLSTNGASWFNGGSVGIGTDSPDSNSKLTITDGASPYSVANTLMQIKRNATNGNDNTSRSAISICNNSNGFTLAYGGSTDRFRILDGGNAERLSITNGGRVGINSTGGVGSLSVYGTVSRGDAHGDPDVTKSYGTNITAVNGSCIEIVSSIASSNTTPTCTITWAKGSWAAFSYFFQYSGASYAGGRYGGGYQNNTGGTISGHNESGYGNDYLTIGGSGQTMTFSFGFPQGYHPSIYARFMGGGGMGGINANEFTVQWTT